MIEYRSRFYHMFRKILYTIFVAVLAMAGAEARLESTISGDWDYTAPDGRTGVVQVPHCRNAEDAAQGVPKTAKDSKSVNSDFYLRGKGIYTKKLDFTPQAGKRYFLRCEGAGIITRVLLNGREVGRHEGAVTSFCFELTPHIKSRDNILTVEVDNTYRDHIAPLRGDFSLFGGLYRPVRLIETDAVCIDPLFFASPGVFITPKAIEKGAEIDVRVRVNNGAASAQKCKVKVELLDDKGEIQDTAEAEEELAAQSVGEVRFMLGLKNARRWDGIQDPYLYTVRTTITAADGSTDTVHQACGIRTAYINAQEGFILNEKPRQLRGVSRHQDKKGKGWAVSPEDEQEDIDLILDMGCDALRTAHYPQSSHIYELCDKAGLIVWSEVSNVNIVRDTPEFRAHNRVFAQEMVYQHWNHPSICLWGYFNEIGHQPEKGLTINQMADELREMEQFIRELDPNRPTASVSNQPQAKSSIMYPCTLALTPTPAGIVRIPLTWLAISQAISATMATRGWASANMAMARPLTNTSNGQRSPDTMEIGTPRSGRAMPMNSTMRQSRQSHGYGEPLYGTCSTSVPPTAKKEA